jgi:GNAT superfamily N-acetyltransferase
MNVATPDRLEGIVIRRATAADSRPTYGVVVEAMEHVARMSGWTASPRPAEPGERFLEFRKSALRHDPDSFWVGEVDGELVGFGIAVQREHVWYLAALHVRPAYQSRGLGAEIIRRALAAARPGSLLTVGTDARNPVSNALYGRFGMFPQEPLLEVSGPAGAATVGAAGSLVPGLPSANVLATIDRAALDVARPEDHEFWGSVPDLHAYSLARDGRPVGYAYVQADGSIGPIAMLDPVDLAVAVEAAIGRAAELGATRARLRIPGVARAAIAGLLARGWRYGDGVTLVLSSAPWGRWDRYVTSGGDALL